jgi:hypothetical protein
LKVRCYALVICAGLFLYSGCAKNEDQPETKAGDGLALPHGMALESQEGRFSVVLPDSSFPRPEKSAQKVSTEVGEITLYLYTSDKSDGSAFIVSYNDYPEHAFVKEIDMMMDDIREGALRNMGAKLESQKDFTFNGHPARSIDFSVSSEGYNGFGRLQYFIAKPRLYQMILLTSERQSLEQDAVKRSFASFKLVK